MSNSNSTTNIVYVFYNGIQFLILHKLHFQNSLKISVEFHYECWSQLYHKTPPHAINYSFREAHFTELLQNELIHSLITLVMMMIVFSVLSTVDWSTQITHAKTTTELFIMWIQLQYNWFVCKYLWQCLPFVNGSTTLWTIFISDHSDCKR